MTPAAAHRLRDRLEARARALGFHGFGVAPAAPLNAQREFYAQWLASGHAAGMDYLSEQAAARDDPAHILPGAKSVICLLTDYRAGWDAGAEPLPPEEGGKVARYARSRDYHIVLKKRLKKLAASLEEWAPGVGSAPCVDSMPLLERAYAWRAGLGFFGKNTMLLTPGTGSYTLLCELLVDVELPASEPGQGTCGGCTRCLDACPTGALVEAGTLDARRCISYWNIEVRGPLPDHADLHGWAFGCDICQEVCPYNFAEGTPPELGADFDTPRAAGPHVRAAEVADFEVYDQFKERFAGTPIMRARIDGLQRNLALLVPDRPEE